MRGLQKNLWDYFDCVFTVMYMSEEKYLGLLLLADTMIDIHLFFWQLIARSFCYRYANRDLAEGIYARPGDIGIL